MASGVLSYCLAFAHAVPSPGILFSSQANRVSVETSLLSLPWSWTRSGPLMCAPKAAIPESVIFSAVCLPLQTGSSATGYPAVSRVDAQLILWRGRMNALSFWTVYWIFLPACLPEWWTLPFPDWGIIIFLPVPSLYMPCPTTSCLVSSSPSLKKNIYLFIWLRWVLVATCRIFSCSMRTLSCSMWDLIPCWGIELGPLHWEHGVLATGPPGKSQLLLLTGKCVCCSLHSKQNCNFSLTSFLSVLSS